jgi:M6 family metalloprotease-like protein
LSRATGIARLGFDDDFITNDVGATRASIRISAQQGTIQEGRDFAAAVGVMCHEFGHVLGLPDLFNVEFLRKKNADPEEDSAGIGAWGLMGWGALGWNGNDGPNSFCAWSRMGLGWANVLEIGQPMESMALQEVGKEGDVYKIPLDDMEFFLLEYRRRRSTYYDRAIP